MRIGISETTSLLAEKAKWAHIDWVKQKEQEEKQRVEKNKRKNAMLEKKKQQSQEGTGSKIAYW